MRIATWNVNSIRARLPRVLAWLEDQSPDVVCLQELKCLDEQFPRDDIEALGYHCETFGQKTYNGVAILSKSTPEDVFRGHPGEVPGVGARVIGATVGDVMLLNLYVVNGKEVGDPKYELKLRWLDGVADFVAQHYPLTDKVVLTGDFNVTFDDRDVYDPKRWHEKILCSTPERLALGKLMEPGYADAFRKFHDEGGHYTWWDFRTRGFDRDHGLRIDHFLMTPPAFEACTGVVIDKDERGREKPSDHAPVIATLA